MPQYFFYIRNGESLRISPDGTECESLDQARTEAVTAAREFIAEKVLNGEVLKVHGVEVRAEDDQPVLFIPIESIVRLGSSTE